MPSQLQSTDVELTVAGGSAAELPSANSRSSITQQGSERLLGELEEAVSDLQTRFQTAHNHAKQIEHSLARHQTARRQRRVAFWISADEEKRALLGERGEKSRRYRTVHFIQSHRVQFALLVLLCLDVLCVLSELFIEAEFPPCCALNF